LIQEHDVNVQIHVQWQGLAFAVGVCCKKVGHVLCHCFGKWKVHSKHKYLRFFMYYISML